MTDQSEGDATRCQPPLAILSHCKEGKKLRHACEVHSPGCRPLKDRTHPVPCQQRGTRVCGLDTRLTDVGRAHPPPDQGLTNDRGERADQLLVCMTQLTWPLLGDIGQSGHALCPCALPCPGLSSRGLLGMGWLFAGPWMHPRLRSLTNSDFPSTPVKTAPSHHPEKFLPLSPRPDNCLCVLCPMVFSLPEYHTKEIIYHAAI